MLFQVFELYLLATVVYAMLRGGAPERITAMLMLVAYLLSLAPLASTHDFARINLNLFLVDFGLFVALYILSLRTTRFWPIWMCAMQGVDVLGHLVPLAEIGPGYGYAIMVQFWAYPMQALLIVATWRHRQRLRRFGADPAWIAPHHIG